MGIGGQDAHWIRLYIALASLCEGPGADRTFLSRHGPGPRCMVADGNTRGQVVHRDGFQAGRPDCYGVIAMATGKSPTLIAFPALLVTVLIGVTECEPLTA